MFYFNNAIWLWAILLIVPLVALLFLAIKKKQQIRHLLGQPVIVANLLRTYKPQRFVLKNLLLIAAFVLLVLAIANLSVNQSGANLHSTKGVDVMLVLDVSNSMFSTDEVPSRLLKAKELLYILCKQLVGNRVGLVVFAGDAYLQMPLSSDMAAAKMFISNADPTTAAVQGTNIGGALALANKSLDTKDSKHKAVVLITDGENHEQSALQQAQTMAQNGTPVFAIGVGKNQGVPLTEAGTSTLKKDVEGNVVISKLNEQLLKELTDKTNGNYWHLDDTQNIAGKLLQKLQSIESKQISNNGNSFTSKTYFHWFAALALLLVTVELFITEKNKL